MNKRKVATHFFIAAILIGVGALVVTLVFGKKAYAHVTEARAKIVHAESLIRSEHAYGLAAQEFDRAAVLFKQAQGELNMLGYLKIVPWVSPYFKTLREGVYSGEVASRAIASLLEVGTKIVPYFDLKESRAIGDIPEAQRKAILGAIVESIPKLQGAGAELRLAQSLLPKISPRGVSGEIGEALVAFDSKVEQVIQMLDEVIPFLEVAPQLLGYPDAKQYLLLLQNSDEMRPTGGFIGTYGLLTIEAGHITNFVTDDVYNLDRFSPASGRPFAPKPLDRYLEQSRWYLRDANWSPDFPTSAKTVLQFYNEELKYVKPQNINTETTELDGVVAVMPEAIIPLLKMVGPITVQGQKFTAENFTDALEYEVEIKFDKKGIARVQRKEIVSELGHVIIEKLFALPPSAWSEVLRSIRIALDEKHILIAATDTGLAALLGSHNWTGGIAQAQSAFLADYLGVFDANLFSLKTDPYVTRTISYSVYKDSIGVLGEVELVYSYPKSGPAWKTKGYRSWTRLYVPKGAELMESAGVMKEEGSSAAGEVEVTEEFDKTVFGAFLAVQLGEVKRMKFKYRLPEAVEATVENGRYELYVQKQAGTEGHGLTVRTDFGKVPKLWSPTGLGASREGSRLTWQSRLQTDQQYEIEF
ncbi:MAG: DUF4012 domain-containing protein [bacterium]|nr:DUF4012 domain-containing protein [bacterium]